MSDKIKITDVNLADYAKKCMTDYGRYTLQDRAIPELKDGLKPVHRRLVWASHVGGYVFNGPTKKCARIVGDTIGKYSPNGDAPVYGALVTLVTNANPLFIGQGNFGCKATGDSEAAMRYSEAKLSKLSELYLLDKDYLAVTPMVPNYDGSLQEPVYLPAKIPVILTQGIEGIATGASTNIPSFSLESVIDLTIESIKKKKCTPKMCFDTLKFKFAEGGKVSSSDDEILEFYKKGEGKLFTVPLVTYDEKAHGIVMKSYSPRLKLDKVFVQGLTVEGIADIEDETGITRGKNNKLEDSGIRIVFKLKKSVTKTDVKKVAKKLLNTIGCSMPYSIMVTDRQDDGENTKFRYTTIPDIVNDWINWRLNFEVKVVNRLVDIEKEKIKKWKYLIWAVDNLTLVFKALKSNDPDKYLVENGDITEEHAKYILDQQTRRLSKLSGDELKSKVKDSKEVISQYKKDISSKDNISKRIVKDLISISK